MNDTENCFAEGDGSDRGGRAITLQAALDDLAQLADELFEVARLFDRAMPEAATAEPSIERMTPQAFFTALLQLRRMRERQFRHDPSDHPGWDIVLQLMLARIAGHDVTLDELSRGSASPPQATWRRLEQLIDAGLVERFENAARLDDFQLSLSGDAALRLAELYRARTRG